MKKVFLVLVLLLAFALPAYATTGDPDFLHDDVLDAAANELATGTRITWCTGLPANFAGINAVLKVFKTVTPRTGALVLNVANGAYTLKEGVTSGRRVEVAAQSGLTGANFYNENAVTVSYQCIDDGTVLLSCVPLATNQSVGASTQTWNANAFSIEFRDM